MRGSLFTLVTLMLFCVLGAGSVGAYSVAKPRSTEVYSPNGQFVLTLDPEHEEQPVYAADDRATPIWTLKQSMWHQGFHLSSDGRVVAVVAWHYVQIDSYGGGAVRFFDANGPLRTHSFEDLCREPYTTDEIVGPVGEFWRCWLWKETATGNELVVHTVDGRIHHFDMNTGELLRTAAGPSMPRQFSWHERYLPHLLVGATVGLVLLLCLRRGCSRRRPN